MTATMTIERLMIRPTTRSTAVQETDTDGRADTNDGNDDNSEVDDASDDVKGGQRRKT